VSEDRALFFGSQFFSVESIPMADYAVCSLLLIILADFQTETLPSHARIIERLRRLLLLRLPGSPEAVGITY